MFETRGWAHTIFVVSQGLFKICEIAPLVRPCDGTHALYLAQLCVFEGELDGEEGSDVFGLVWGVNGQNAWRKVGLVTRLSMTLQRSMYLSAPSAPASPCEERFSKASKK